MIRLGSLFSGVGGLELGIEQAFNATGYPCKTSWQVEINDVARRVLARHWPHARQYDDVPQVAFVVGLELVRIFESDLE